MAAFSCNACGICCKLVKAIYPNWPTRPDGACVHLTPENKCAIYETRPKECRVDANKPKGMVLEDWQKFVASGCAELQKGAH